MGGIGSHTRPNQGESDDWLTPPEIIEALGEFDCDPCASVDQPWRTAKVQHTILENGLMQPWRGRVWLNPPYGLQAADWLQKLAAHGNGIALVFARTETAMFERHVWGKAKALLFLFGRLFFRHPKTGTRAKHNSGGPSVLIAYGDANVRSLRDSGLRGYLAF